MSQHKGRVGTLQHTLFDITVGRTQLIPSVMWMGLLLRCVLADEMVFSPLLPPPLLAFRAHNITKSYVGNQIKLMGGRGGCNRRLAPEAPGWGEESNAYKTGSKDRMGKEERAMDTPPELFPSLTRRLFRFPTLT